MKPIRMKWLWGLLVVVLCYIAYFSSYLSLDRQAREKFVVIEDVIQGKGVIYNSYFVWTGRDEITIKSENITGDYFDMSHRQGHLSIVVDPELDVKNLKKTPGSKPAPFDNQP